MVCVSHLGFANLPKSEAIHQALWEHEHRGARVNHRINLLVPGGIEEIGNLDAFNHLFSAG